MSVFCADKPLPVGIDKSTQAENGNCLVFVRGLFFFSWNLRINQFAAKRRSVKEFMNTGKTKTADKKTWLFEEAPVSKAVWTLAIPTIDDYYTAH